MKTTTNERLGLIALSIVLALIVAMAIWNSRQDPTERVEVVVEQNGDVKSSHASDSVASKPKKGKKGTKQKPAPKVGPQRRPLDQPVNPR